MKQHIKAAINLYIILTINELKETLDHYKVKYIKNELFKVFDEINEDPYTNLYYDDYLLTSGYFPLETVDEVNHAYEYHYEISHVPLNLLEENEFLKYSDNFYIQERESLDNLVKFIRENNITNLSDLDIKEHIADYEYNAIVLDDSETFIKRLRNIGFTFKDIDILNEFIRLLDLTIEDLYYF